MPLEYTPRNFYIFYRIFSSRLESYSCPVNTAISFKETTPDEVEVNVAFDSQTGKEEFICRGTPRLSIICGNCKIRDKAFPVS